MHAAENRTKQVRLGVRGGRGPGGVAVAVSWCADCAGGVNVQPG